MEFNLKKEGKYTYIEEGEGEVVLLLHGLFGALSNWKDVLDKFKPNYKIVIPLMPLYELPILGTSVKGLAEFIHKFVEFKGYNNITLLGNSLGGHVGLVYYLAHPERVKSMVLTGSSGLYENAFGGSYPKRGDREYIRKKVEYTFYDPAIVTEELVDEVLEITNNREKVIRVLALAKSAIRHNVGKELGRIKIPVCLIWGKQDKITPPEVAEEFKQNIENSELHWMDQCGHAPMMEKPSEFNIILDDFLSRIHNKKEVNS